MDRPNKRNVHEISDEETKNLENKRMKTQSSMNAYGDGQPVRIGNESECCDTQQETQSTQQYSLEEEDHWLKDDYFDSLNKEGAKDKNGERSPIASITNNPLPVIEKVDDLPGPSDKLQRNSSSKGSLKQVPSVRNDAETIACMLEMKESQDIYNRLLQKRSLSNRMEVVMDEILDGGMEQVRRKVNEDAVQANISAEADVLFQDVTRVITAVQAINSKLNCDPNAVYLLLEKHASSETRVESAVMEVLAEVKNKESSKNNGVTGVSHENGRGLKVAMIRPEAQVSIYKPNYIAADAGAQRVKNDPLFTDMNAISKIFPNVDKNEIYAYLEAHFDKPNRIQIVTDELLSMGRDSQESSTGAPSLDAPPNDSNDSYADLINPPISAIEKEVSAIVTIVPDCDPNYLYEKLEEMGSEADRVEKLSAILLEKRNYPKLKERIDLEQKAANRRRLQNLDINIKDFLSMFPDPEATFFDETTAVSETYKSHATIQLRNDFPMLHTKYITKTFEEHQSHYAPSKRTLEIYAHEYDTNRNRALQHKRYRKTLRDPEGMPENPDEIFYRELFYTRKEQFIIDYIQSEKEAKERRLAAAKENGELHECGCCYDDECLFEDMDTCPDGHLFCKECIRRSAEEAIGVAKIKIPCLSGDCKLEFSLTVLQGVLNSKTFSLLLRKIQEEEIRQADIDGLESCPFCSFATIIGNPEDKVFKCMNPDCLKESCRQCKEPNHIPLRCDEVEKQGETTMRAFIENKITEAMVRTCWKCKKRFYKTEGCNKMTCTCGASMCYVCRKPIKDYSHFGRGGCPQDTDVMKLHQIEMEKAAKEAKEKYEEEHPELAGTALKYDPMKHLDDLKNNVRGNPHGYYEEDEYDEDEEEDYEDHDDEEEIGDYDDEEYNRAVQEFMEWQRNTNL